MNSNLGILFVQNNENVKMEDNEPRHSAVKTDDFTYNIDEINEMLTEIEKYEDDKKLQQKQADSADIGNDTDNAEIVPLETDTKQKQSNHKSPTAVRVMQKSNSTSSDDDINENDDDDNNNNVKPLEIEEPKNMSDKLKSTLSTYSRIIGNPAAFISIYIFMVSDFYVRTYPFVGLLAFLNKNHLFFIEIIVGIVLFIFLGFIGYYLCKWMRIKTHKKNKEITSIFAITIISSFYNLLCCIPDLKDINFFDQACSSTKFIAAHILRMMITFIMYIIYIAVASSSISNDFSFVIVFAVFFLLNLVSIESVKRFIAPKTTYFDIVKEYKSLLQIND